MAQLQRQSHRPASAWAAPAKLPKGEHANGTEYNPRGYKGTILSTSTGEWNTAAKNGDLNLCQETCTGERVTASVLPATTQSCERLPASQGRWRGKPAEFTSSCLPLSLILISKGELQCLWPRPSEKNSWHGSHQKYKTGAPKYGTHLQSGLAILTSLTHKTDLRGKMFIGKEHQDQTKNNTSQSHTHTQKKKHNLGTHWIDF